MSLPCLKPWANLSLFMCCQLSYQCTLKQGSREGGPDSNFNSGPPLLQCALWVSHKYVYLSVITLLYSFATAEYQRHCLQKLLGSLKSKTLILKVKSLYFIHIAVLALTWQVFPSLRGRVKLLEGRFPSGSFSKRWNGCDSLFKMQELGLHWQSAQRPWQRRYAEA